MSYAIRVSSLDHAPTRSSGLIVGDKQNDTCCANFPCCGAFNHTTVYVVATVIWALGALVCGMKAHELLDLSRDLGANSTDVRITVVVCACIGSILGKYWFVHLAERNIKRMSDMATPLWHSSFRWQLWLFLCLFDTSFYGISDGLKYSKGVSHVTALVFAGLDVSICASLTVSFYVYFREWSVFHEEALESASTVNALNSTLLDPSKTLSDAMQAGSHSHSHQGSRSNGTRGSASAGLSAV